ncbi:hypothetical protein [Rosenbergiella metrosideri]|uniref:hypothetical protein n=1 Tax=Rosenbergiella metrosideri TaxID=2921185 RepID=UPI001F503232|nr:hypothetical protein [Rosenbergiella metrosideri]
MLPRIETARLILAPLVKEDAPLIQQAFPRWDIVKYLTRKDWTIYHFQYFQR